MTQDEQILPFGHELVSCNLRDGAVGFLRERAG
jgi:hypothetical protein